MKHIFEIKDLVATKESAKHICESQIDVLLKVAVDIDIAGINVFINDIDASNYEKDYSGSPVKFIPTLHKHKKNTEVEKQSFAAFHNFVVNASTPHLNADDVIVHIMDGTLDLIDTESEFKKKSTRVGEMICDIYDMMNLLDHPVWFNTASDKGNIKFGHYFTMIDFINIDETFKIDIFPECIMYSGNSNLDWIIIDAAKYKKAKMPSLIMNSNYLYDFLSIKQLIAKFVDFDTGYYDSMFPTVPTEVGAYFRNTEFDKDLQRYDMSKYQENLKQYQLNLKEYKKLKQVNISNVVDFVRAKIISKLPDSDKEKLQQFAQTIS